MYPSFPARCLGEIEGVRWKNVLLIPTRGPASTTESQLADSNSALYAIRSMRTAFDHATLEAAAGSTDCRRLGVRLVSSDDDC